MNKIATEIRKKAYDLTAGVSDTAMSMVAPMGAPVRKVKQQLANQKPVSTGKAVATGAAIGAGAGTAIVGGGRSAYNAASRAKRKMSMAYNRVPAGTSKIRAGLSAAKAGAKSIASTTRAGLRTPGGKVVAGVTAGMAAANAIENKMRQRKFRKQQG